MADFVTPVRASEEDFSLSLEVINRAFENEAAALVVTAFPTSFRRWVHVFDVTKAGISDDEWERTRPIIAFLDHLMFFAFESKPDAESLMGWLEDYEEDAETRNQLSETALQRIEQLEERLADVGTLWKRKTHSTIPVLEEPDFEVFTDAKSESAQAVFAIRASRIGHGPIQTGPTVELRLFQSDVAYLTHILGMVDRELKGRPSKGNSTEESAR